MPQRTYADRLKRATARRSACDWCSTTAKTQEAQEALWSLGERLLSASALEGEQPTRWHAHGYGGWSVKGCALGKRSDSVHLRLSQHQAAQEWKHALAAAENCTRFDAALDLHFDVPVSRLARDSYLHCVHVRSSMGRPPARRLIISGDGGSTFYTGSRASQRLGRLYDKGVESKTLPPGRWWRWEVEFKAESAVALADAADRAEDPAELMESVVATFFRRRCGIAPTCVRPLEIYNLPSTPTSDEKLLEWLAVGVRPTVARLMERLGRERVSFSLGLPLKSAVHGGELETTLN
jgi:hypothetical protein